MSRNLNTYTVGDGSDFISTTSTRSAPQCSQCGQMMGGPEFTRHGPHDKFDAALRWTCACGWQAYSLTAEQERLIVSGDYEPYHFWVNRGRR